MDSGPISEGSPRFFQVLDNALKLLSPEVMDRELVRAELLEKAIDLHMARGPAYGRAHSCEVSKAFVDESRKLGFIDAALPSSNEYRYAVIDGNTLPIMSLSANFLAHLCRDHHVSVGRIIMLGSKRKAAIEGCGNDGAMPWDLPIDTSAFKENMFHPDIQPKVELTDVEADTEYSLACQLREEWAMKGPAEMRGLWCNAEVVGADEKANTIATVQNWLDQNFPLPGSVLYVSMQPFLMGLRTGLRKWLAHTDFKDQKLDVVGPGLTEKVQSKEFGLVLLDRIGAWAHVTMYDPEIMPPRAPSLPNSWNEGQDSETEPLEPSPGGSELSADLKRAMMEEFVKTCTPAVETVQKVGTLPTSTGTNSEY
eukprot:Skav210028  [mRNA]  locus=scaffold706:50605:51705:+ [translate_table: standard]